MNHNQELTPTDKDWYNAGIMAQRILQNDEIETLKAKFKKEEQDHYYTRCAWEETSKERDELKNQNLALQDRIRIMQEQLIIGIVQIVYGWLILFFVNFDSKHFSVSTSTINVWFNPIKELVYFAIVVFNVCSAT